MLLPWCITAGMIGGAEYLGSIRLVEGSQNYVFRRDGEAVMVVWNPTPVVETVYLGENVQQLDLWGRVQQKLDPQQKPGQKQQIAVGAMPTFITGVNLPLAQWRMACAFEPSELDSVFGEHQPTKLRFRNTFPEGISGNLQIRTPDVWDVQNYDSYFSLAGDEEAEQKFYVLFHTDANSGLQTVRVDFDVTFDRRYQFSIYRELRVGSSDVSIELNSWIDANGHLIVEQHLVNNSEQSLNFNCLLFAPGRRRARQQLLGVGPGHHTHTFALPNGKELVGKTLWLRAEELGGRRLLNYHVTAQQ